MKWRAVGLKFRSEFLNISEVSLRFHVEWIVALRLKCQNRHNVAVPLRWSHWPARSSCGRPPHKFGEKRVFADYSQEHTQNDVERVWTPTQVFRICGCKPPTERFFGALGPHRSLRIHCDSNLWENLGETKRKKWIEDFTCLLLAGMSVYFH